MITEMFLQSSRPAAFMVGGSVHWLSNFTVGLVFLYMEVRTPAQGRPGLHIGLFTPLFLQRGFEELYMHLLVLKTCVWGCVKARD